MSLERSERLSRTFAYASDAQTGDNREFPLLTDTGPSTMALYARCPARSRHSANGRFPPKGEVAGSKNVWVAVDPERAFKIEPMNGRKALESGLRLKA